MAVRKIGPSSYTNTGYIPNSKGVRVQRTESMLEQQFLSLLDYDNRVRGYQAQPFKIRWRAPNGRWREFTPDVIVSYTADAQAEEPWLDIEPILARDESIGNRFRPVYLPSWTDKRLEEYARFIKTILKHFKLANPSNLMDEKALGQLLHFSDGLLGESVRILTVLAEMAIRTGDEVIEPKHIAQHYLDAAGYVPPAKGRSQYI
ncbi:hypothetical protein N5C93_01935 [Pseudomonas nitroreducens]|uniref:hypothetical protein n=1 Tax=Pseudomonas nitroreducens TaxID=46680 RepID=UPI0024470524|nr:hypothetical protein [Pseudomonas nitroreducens]EKV4131621.1 hypothetical protein [Pseudomonas aeruginosa]EKW1535914.1 hypothetical protein [Pseudomonas aeruginosa]ELQ7978531.1 hypothetical protein [Pseudomonas aeruginosa]ELV3002730.1 hypothetical protein [Pseudomonas aeruginosa]MDH1071584.1 hypothetical protein [Pseudomonas nitroreducens]